MVVIFRTSRKEKPITGRLAASTIISTNTARKLLTIGMFLYRASES
jgi:hypothetical protein